MYLLVGEFLVSWIIQYSPTTRFSCHVVFSRNQISCYTRTRCSILIWICVLMIKSSRMIEIFVLWNSNKFIWICVCEQINLISFTLDWPLFPSSLSSPPSFIRPASKIIWTAALSCRYKFLSVILPEWWITN